MLIANHISREKPRGPPVQIGTVVGSYPNKPRSSALRPGPRCSRCCGCGRGLGGGAWVTAPLPSAEDGVWEPDDRKPEDVPSNRGISSGVTTSTTIASGRGTNTKGKCPTVPQTATLEWIRTNQKQPDDQGTQVADSRND
jgi:hypothetical protein